MKYNLSLLISYAESKVESRQVEGVGIITIIPYDREWYSGTRLCDTFHVIIYYT